MRFSVVIPNWNGEKFLKACFDSLRNQDFKDFEVIVIDNGSTDRSVEIIKKKYPWIELVVLDRNYGFPIAANAGIKKAKGDLIALLNNDTEADYRWLSSLNEAAKNHPECSFFASKMLDFTDRNVVDAAGDGMNWSGMPYKIGCLENSKKYETERYVFGACGGASVYRKEFFRTVGYFDEDFGFYLEDVDLDFRGQLAGLKCLFTPKAIIYHIGSATAGKKSAFSFKMSFKNRHHVIYKNFPWQAIILNLHKIFYAEIRCFGAAVRDGFVKEYFWALGKALVEWPKMIRKRHAIQDKRRVTLKYLNTIVDQKFNFRPVFTALKLWHNQRSQS